VPFGGITSVEGESRRSRETSGGEEEHQSRFTALLAVAPKAERRTKGKNLTRENHSCSVKVRYVILGMVYQLRQEH